MLVDNYVACWESTSAEFGCLGYIMLDTDQLREYYASLSDKNQPEFMWYASTNDNEKVPSSDRIPPPE